MAGLGQPSVRVCVMRIELDGATQQRFSGCSVEGPDVLAPAEHAVVGAKMLRGCAALVLGHCRRNSAFQPGHDAADDLVLKSEDVLHVAVVSVAPDVVAGGGLDKLNCNTHAVAQLAH